jgi:hypothetical protein
MTESWIVVTRWDEFQHYSKRDPIWVKVYTRLLADENYLGLTFHQRGVLQGIWLEYARSTRQLPGSTLSLTRRLGGKVSTRDLAALSDAGFIAIVASTPLAARYHDASPETETETETYNPVTEPVLEQPTRDEDNGSGLGADPDEINRILAEAAVKDMPSW